MLRKGGMAERGDPPFEFGYRLFSPVGELVQNAHAFGIAHRTQNGCQFGLFAFNVGKPRHGQFSPPRRSAPTGASVLHLGPEGL